MLFTRAANVTLERRAHTAPGAQWGNSDPPSPGSHGGMSASGTHVSENTALQVAAVYGSVSVIAGAVSALPLELFSSTDPATKRRLPPGLLLTKPYAEISRIDWLKQYVMSMALRGNFYGYVVERDTDLYPTQIQPIHPDWVSVRRISSGPDKGRPDYRFFGQKVSTDNVFHIRNLSLPGALVGLNPIEMLRITLGLARAADLYGGSFFANSALPTGVLEVEDDMTPDAVKRLAVQWRDAHQGVDSAHMPAVLTGGAKFHAISMTPEDSQFLESRQFSQGEISGMIFRVPPHMIGLVSKSTSWGTGIAQQEQGFVTNTLIDYLGPLEEAFTEIGPQDGRVNKFKVSTRMRGDKLQRYQAYGLGLAGGFLCPDDAREEEDMKPLPDELGQTYMVPINSQTLEQAVKDTMTPPIPPPPAVDDTQGEGGKDG